VFTYDRKEDLYGKMDTGPKVSFEDSMLLDTIRAMRRDRQNTLRMKHSKK